MVKRNPNAYEEVRRYTVADSQTWAQPVLLGNRLVIRDERFVSLWSLR